MPAMANIVINDGKATPIAHTFKPLTTDGQLAVFQESGATMLDALRIVTQVRRPTTETADGVFRVRQSLQIPHTGVNAGTGKLEVTYKEMGAVEVTYSAASTEQQRKDWRTMMANLLLNAQAAPNHDQLEPHY